MTSRVRYQVLLVGLSGRAGRPRPDTDIARRYLSGE